MNLKLKGCQWFTQGHSQTNEVELGFMLMHDPKVYTILFFFFFLSPMDYIYQVRELRWSPFVS